MTCGTVLKLINTDLKLRLHSHDVKYGSGSGQQSVTAVDVSDDNNSHWLVKPVMGETCKRGYALKLFIINIHYKLYSDYICLKQ